MTIKTISGGRNNKEQWWNLNNATTLLYTSEHDAPHQQPKWELGSSQSNIETKRYSSLH